MPFTKVLGQAEGKVARALLGGHAPSIAKAVLEREDVKEEVIKQLLREINEECSKLCSKTAISPYRTIPVDQLAGLKWKDMAEELQQKAPLLFSVLLSIVSRNDNRNVVKVAAAHYPGICSVAAILLKERNREMCGLQSLVSLLMFSCHAEKQVYCIYNTIFIRVCTILKYVLIIKNWHIIISMYTPHLNHSCTLNYFKLTFFSCTDA